MLRIGIRDYIVRVNPMLYNDFIEIYDVDDSKIEEEEEARKYIGQKVACFRFSDGGFMYEKYLAILKDIKKVRDRNFDLDTWEIEIEVIPRSVMYYDEKGIIKNKYEKYIETE